MSLSHSPKIVTDGLVLCLDAANQKSYQGSGTNWKSLAKTNSNFTLANSPTFSDGSFLFDGINDYASSTTSNFLKWENWSKLSFTIAFNHISGIGGGGGGNNRSYIIDFRNSGGLSGALGLFVDGVTTSQKELTLFYNTIDNQYEEPTVATYGFNEWIVYTCTFDKTSTSNNIRHYVNGANVFNRSRLIDSDTSNGNGTIWLARYSNNNYRFNGKIAFFSANTEVILTPEQVKQNYNAIRARYGI